MKKSNKVTFLTQAAVIAAIYVVLTIIFAPFSFGEVQVRISEALTTCHSSHRLRFRDCLSDVLLPTCSAVQSLLILFSAALPHCLEPSELMPCVKRADS